MEIDITQALKDTENALRDFISQVLQSALGDGWEGKCGVSEESVAKWKERKEVDAKRQAAGVADERLIYYADFYDLQTILKKHWDHFSEIFGEWEIMEGAVQTDDRYD